jgi:sarcosine oxidase gamma subunit
MRETAWPPARRAEGLLIDGPRLKASAVSGRGHMLISGDLDAAIAALAPGAPMLGLYALAPDAAHALRIGRDSALLVTPAPVSAPEGWRDNWCATALDDGWTAIDVSGPDAALALAQGISADVEAGSASAAALFAGFRCLLSRTPDGFRVHVERPWLEALMAWLDGA